MKSGGIGGVQYLATRHSIVELTWRSKHGDMIREYCDDVRRSCSTRCRETAQTEK